MIDSNATGLRIAEEDTIGVLPVTPVWNPHEPNSYADLGGTVRTVTRRPLEPGRQIRKGTKVAVDAGGAFNTDLTQDNMTELLQGLIFADIEEPETTSAAITDITGGVITSAGIDALFAVGDLLLGSGGDVADQNVLLRVTATASNTITVTPAPANDASPATTYVLTQVGFQFGVGDLAVDAAGVLPAITTSTKDLTQLGWQPGEWIFLGGDAAGTRFTNTSGGNLLNTGFARLRTVAANRADFDLTEYTMTTEAAGALTVQVFHGRVLHNQAAAADQVRRTYQLERTLGEDGVGTQSEYLTGQVWAESVFNFPLEDKVNMDATFIGLGHETRTGTVGVKSGTRPSLVSAEPFNTASDIEYRMAVYTEGTTAPTPLFTYIRELTLTVNNNASVVKALGADSGIDVTVGAFQVSAAATAIFEEVAAIEAVRSVADVTLNWRLVRENAGIHFDLPLLTLGDARANIEQDTEIRLPLTAEAATGASLNSTALNHTLMITFFPYLPDLAE